MGTHRVAEARERKAVLDFNPLQWKEGVHDREPKETWKPRQEAAQTHNKKVMSKAEQLKEKAA